MNRQQDIDTSEVNRITNQNEGGITSGDVVQKQLRNGGWGGWMHELNMAHELLQNKQKIQWR